MAKQFVLKRDSVDQKPAFTIDYRADLNDQQYAVVTSGRGPVLVVAGAGTGKTRTLVFRVAFLVESGVPPENILLLTFTRRAAREMLMRASTLLDGRCERVQGGTFHSYCLYVLRRHAGHVGYDAAFSILDASDAADVIDVVRTEMGLHRSEKRFPRKRALQNMFSTAVNRNLSLHDVVEENYPQFLHFLEELMVLRNEFHAYKEQYGLMDYDDLLKNTLKLFEEHPDVRKQIAAQCRHVLVDEYQDTNRLQATLVQAFSSFHGNVMAVGDDAQSIYRFRGADFRNIMEFPQDFPGTRILKLEHNYRSTQYILDVANHIIDEARRKHEKHLFTDKNRGETPALVSAPDERAQSRFVCQLALQLREQGVPLNRMAVLFRGGHDSFDLEAELNRRGIPYVKYGGMKLTEAAHVKDVLAYVKVLENPRDAVAWNRILLLLEGIGPKTASDLLAFISAARDPYALEGLNINSNYVEGLIAMMKMLSGLRASPMSVQSQVERLLEFYQPLLERVYFEDYQKRAADLEHFAALTSNYRDRSELLGALALEPIDMTALAANPTDEDERPLVLSTIHSAKGLEFHSVFLIQMLDGILPSGYSLRDEEALEEERRLLYVAVTRAEENLFLSYPVLQNQRGSGSYFSKISRFLEQIPETLLEPWSLIEEEETAPARIADHTGPAPRIEYEDPRRRHE